MTEQDRWQHHNDQYLAAALSWLRLRLGWKIVQHRTANRQVDSLPEVLAKIDQIKVAQAAQAMAQAAATEPPPALILLSRRLGLSPFEQDILLLCAAMELDVHVPTLCANLPPKQPQPTFALALSLFDQPAWDALSADRPLRYWQLIQIHQPAAQSLTTSPLQIDERIVNYLKGLNNLDDRLAPFLVPLEADLDAVELPPSQQAMAETVLGQMTRPSGHRALPVVQLLGTNDLSQQLVARQVAEALGRYLYRLPLELLPAPVSDLESIARLWQRESLLLPLALYLDAQNADLSSATAGQLSVLQRFLARSDGLIFLATLDQQRNLGRAAIAIEVRKPTAAEQENAWAMALGDSAEHSPALLAAQFSLNLAEIQQVAESVFAEAADITPPIHDQLWDGCLAVSRPRLDALAQPIEPKATWEDIVLPEEELELLHQLADQVSQRHQVYNQWGFRRRMNRGLGINALFAGDSGTGKTMAAEVIANALRLNLYRIDLSAVVSKFIGETEKNLRRLFDAAEDGGAVLFFDEADALFGKRSEVKDSHDRYANIEINYLLQRMESYRGLAILATNLKSSLDTAFLRRLRFVINFSFPGLPERKAIWQGAFPPETPTEGLDYEHLARFNLTGGNIHNVVLNAAFQAAKAQTAVTMPLVLAAVRTELKKCDRPINELDFCDPFDLDSLNSEAYPLARR